MATEDTHGLGYHRVDDDPNVNVLIATMDGTAGWDATIRLGRGSEHISAWLMVNDCSTSAAASFSDRATSTAATTTT